MCDRYHGNTCDLSHMLVHFPKLQNVLAFNLESHSYSDIRAVNHSKRSFRKILHIWTVKKAGGLIVPHNKELEDGLPPFMLPAS